MKLWKVDRKALEIRMVEVADNIVVEEPYFKTLEEGAAWFRRDAAALISLTAVDVETAERQLIKARERAGDAVKYAARVASVFPR